MKNHKKVNQSAPSKTMQYETKDLILPMIGVPDPCPICITVDDELVTLSIGGRDIEWDRKTGEFIGAGTCVGDWSESD